MTLKSNNVPRFWVQVNGVEMRKSRRVISEKTTVWGRRTVTKTVSQTTEEPYVILSCGHEYRAIDFDHGRKDRKRVDCFWCAKDAGFYQHTLPSTDDKTDE